MSEGFSSAEENEAEQATVEQRVAEAYSSLGRLSLDAARGVQAFQARVVWALDELRSALGEAYGEIWCDWNPAGEIRLKVGVAGAGYPPAGALVQAATLVLKRHELLEASDFVEVSIGMTDRLADLARVSAVLGDSGLFARASLRPDSQSRAQLHRGNVRTRVYIETVRGLTSEQKAIVEYAATLARGPVEIQACLGPGWEFAPTPLSEVEWVPVGVDPDLRTLNVMYSWNQYFGLPPSLTLSEASREIEITVALPDLRRDPEVTWFPAVLIGRLSRRLVVRLADRVGGRRITGNGCLLATVETGIARDPLLEHQVGGRIVVPNTVGLHPEDAQSLLRLQGFRAEIEGSGPEVTATDPAAHEPTSRRRPILLRTTPP